MMTSRAVAMASSVALATLCATLVAVGRVPAGEAMWAAIAVALVFIPTGSWAPVGWRRRVAEASVILPAWALIMLGDAVQRRVLLPPLLVVAGWAAVTAAWPRIPDRRRAAVVVLFALSCRAAAGMGLAGWEPWRIGVAAAAAGVTAWAAARIGGRDLGIAVAMLFPLVPVDLVPVVGAVAVGVSLAAGRFGGRRVAGSRWLGWVPGLVGVALLAMTVSPWGGLGIDELYPAMSWWTIAAVGVALVVTRRVHPGVAGLIWLLVALTAGPVLAPTPDRRGFVLGGELADVDMPAGSGAPYVLDIGLDGSAELPPGRAVAWFRVGERTHRLLYPDHAVFRSGPNPDGGPRVWRPGGQGRVSTWRSAVRTIFEVPEGTVPRLIRHPDLAETVTVVLETEGPALPTSPRSRGLSWWLVAAALVVGVIQIASGVWRTEFAVAPWTILVFGALTARVWVEPLRLLAERHAVDLALAAVLTAWLPAAAVWLRDRRVTATLAALLVPLAMAAPQLTPPLHGDEPFHIAVMRSIVEDRDLDLTDNLDLEGHPQEASFQQDDDLLHSPVLGALLVPGFAVGGRSGALVLLALAASLAAALVFRRARRLGVPEARLRLLMVIVAATYPMAVFTGQIWVEMVGALAVSGILLAAAAGRGGRWAAVVWALVATAVKTRLGLLVFPPAAAAWLVSRRGRGKGLVVLVGTGVVAMAVGWATMGHPFGVYRRLGDLVPSDPGLAGRVLGGLAVDPAGGLLFAAPLWLVALAGTVALWRRGGPGERMLLVGCAATMLALLHSIEWYGGGSPPARYLVPMMPAVVLAGGMLLREPRRWRRAAEMFVLPSLAVWWVLVTRPHLSINPGDGGWWATDALARSYLVDTAWLVPSFLVPRTATWVVPVAVVVITAMVAAVARLRPVIARRLAAAGAALWLLGAAGLVAAIETRTDRVVEAEAPQVRRHGGRPHPREGTFSRFTHRRGWRLADGEGATVPLNLPPNAQVVVEGFLLGHARRGAELELVWDDGEPIAVAVRGETRDGRLSVPDVPGAGRHRLKMIVHARPHSAVVLDRVVVEGGR